MHGLRLCRGELAGRTGYPLLPTHRFPARDSAHASPSKKRPRAVSMTSPEVPIEAREMLAELHGEVTQQLRTGM